MTDDEVEAALTAVPGIGIWTAQEAAGPIGPAFSQDVTYTITVPG